mmetsp:Transcript_6854/g.11567  ORF Transcript_6854/g.11567 Transcript_6854/m.11567 type:complete len:136 (-) Transcript_6854:807-1214(-)
MEDPRIQNHDLVDSKMDQHSTEKLLVLDRADKLHPQHGTTIFKSRTASRYQAVDGGSKLSQLPKIKVVQQKSPVKVTKAQESKSKYIRSGAQDHFNSSKAIVMGVGSGRDSRPQHNRPSSLHGNIITLGESRKDE